MPTEATISINAFGQPVGPDVPGWTPCARPSDEPLAGRFCRLEPYDAGRHLKPLFATYAQDDGRMWTYVPWGPFPDAEAMGQVIRFTGELAPQPFQRFVILEAASGDPVGEASYMRHAPDLGAIEVGAVTFGPRLKRTPAATEAMHLMMRRVFETGYRRYEWKCDALNAASRAAAQRLGFTFEGVFRNERVYKGRSRDTAWFSVIDRDWPALRRAMERWLDQANFDGAGAQRRRLAELVVEERGHAG
jgi:RimJ/RimL family protein N-acetyltransferase